MTQVLVLLGAGLTVAYTLDQAAGHATPTLFWLALLGSGISYIYSAPPLKLKQSGWIGNYALGCSYITLPWLAGQMLFGTVTADIVVLTALYSVAGLGIAIVNDFKSIEGASVEGWWDCLIMFLSLFMTSSLFPICLFPIYIYQSLSSSFNFNGIFISQSFNIIAFSLYFSPS